MHGRNILIVIIPKPIRPLGSFPASAFSNASAAERKLEILKQCLGQAQNQEGGAKYYRYDQYAHDIDENHGLMAAAFRCRVFAAAVRRVKDMLIRIIFYKINPDRADIHAVISVGNNSSLTGVIRLIINCGIGIVKGGCSGHNNIIVLVQGQQRLGAAEYICAAVKCTRIVYIIFCLRQEPAIGAAKSKKRACLRNRRVTGGDR